MSDGSGLRERIATALLNNPDIYLHTYSADSLPYKVMDATGAEPVMLSEWADVEEARRQAAWTIACRRSAAALATIEAAGFVLCPLEPTEEMLDAGGRKPSTSGYFARITWQAMLANRPKP